MSILKRVLEQIHFKKKILSLKMKYGKQVKISWSAKISPTAIFRINNNGFIQVGDQVIIREYVILNSSDQGSIKIHSHSFLNDFTCVNAMTSIEIGSHTIIGQGVKIYDHDHNYRSKAFGNSYISSSLKIGNRVWIGSNAMILEKCHKIGHRSVIAGGTIVHENLSNKTLYYTKRENEKRNLKKYIKE